MCAMEPRNLCELPRPSLPREVVSCARVSPDSRPRTRAMDDDWCFETEEGLLRALAERICLWQRDDGVQELTALTRRLVDLDLSSRPLRFLNALWDSGAVEALVVARGVAPPTPGKHEVFTFPCTFAQLVRCLTAARTDQSERLRSSGALDAAVRIASDPSLGGVTRSAAFGALFNLAARDANTGRARPVISRAIVEETALPLIDKAGVRARTAQSALELLYRWGENVGLRGEFIDVVKAKAGRLVNLFNRCVDDRVLKLVLQVLSPGVCTGAWAAPVVDRLNFGKLCMLAACHMCTGLPRAATRMIADISAVSESHRSDGSSIARSLVQGGAANVLASAGTSWSSHSEAVCLALSNLAAGGEGITRMLCEAGALEKLGSCLDSFREGGVVLEAAAALANFLVTSETHEEAVRVLAVGASRERIARLRKALENSRGADERTVETARVYADRVRDRMRA